MYGISLLWREDPKKLIRITENKNLQLKKSTVNKPLWIDVHLTSSTDIIIGDRRLLLWTEDPYMDKTLLLCIENSVLWQKTSSMDETSVNRRHLL